MFCALLALKCWDRSGVRCTRKPRWRMALEWVLFPPRARPSVSQYDLRVCLFVKKFFCFWMCLPIAVAPCSLRVLFAAPFKERLKAHLICKAPQFPKNPTQPLSIPEQTAILPFSPSRLSGHAARSTETAGSGGKNATPSHPISRALWRRSGRVYRRDG